MKSSGREKEVKIIKEANRASAVGKLMLGEIKDWNEFLECDTIDYKQLPRRQLKSGRLDVQSRLSKEIKSFCNKNFKNISIKKLSKLYEEIKSKRGIEITLNDFEDAYGKIKSSVSSGNPKHLTVCISLWGLQFKFPEDYISKDLTVGLEILSTADIQLNEFESKDHKILIENREKVQSIIRKKEFAQRTIILACFNLIEAYLNGIAWNYYYSGDISELSNKKKKLLQDTTSSSIRDKLLKYPEIISGCKFTYNDEIEDFLESIKPFRDSLVHASPFSAPEKFGGYNKLRKIYDLNNVIAILAVYYSIKIIKEINNHLKNEKIPNWLNELEKFLNSKWEITIEESERKAVLKQ